MILCNILHNKGGVCKKYYCAIKPRSETLSYKGQRGGGSGDCSSDDGAGCDDSVGGVGDGDRRTANAGGTGRGLRGATAA